MLKFLKNFAFAFVVLLAGLSAAMAVLAAATFGMAYMFGPIGVPVGVAVLGSAAVAFGFAASESEK